MNNSKLSITIIAVLITTLTIPQAFAEREGDTYDGNTGTYTPLIEPTDCDTATQSDQCSVVDSANLPPYALAVINDQGGDILNPDECNFLLLTSGDPLDADVTLSTNRANPGCGLNPDGFATNDCVDVTVTPSDDSLVLAWSAEYPEYLASSFTDWDRIGETVSVSINDWVGAPSLVLNPAYGPDIIGSVTEGTIAGGSTVTLRVADSGDFILDTGKIVVPLSCLTDPKPPLLCGNSNVDPGEQCDDGNNVGGDGCSAICTFEGVVGGESLSIDNTTLLLAGAQANSVWILSALAVIGSVAFGALYITTKRN